MESAEGAGTAIVEDPNDDSHDVGPSLDDSDQILFLLFEHLKEQQEKNRQIHEAFLMQMKKVASTNTSYRAMAQPASSSLKRETPTKPKDEERALSS